MATTLKKTIDVLLLNHEGATTYLPIEPDYRTDGGASEKKVTDTLDAVKKSLDAGLNNYIEGVSYQTTRAGSVGIVWIEIEGFTTEILNDGQDWLNKIGEDWAKKNGWDKQPSNNRKGYTGFALQSK